MMRCDKNGMLSVCECLRLEKKSLLKDFERKVLKNFFHLNFLSVTQ